MKFRELIFWVFTFVIGILSLKLTSHLDLWLKMCIRVPEVYIMAYIYKKFVNRGYMRTNVKKWRLKGWLHYLVLLIGVIEFIYMLYKTRIDHLPKLSIEEMVELLLNTPIHYILLAALMALPFYYAFVQFIFYLRIITVWVYNNRRKWFEISLLGEDIVIVGILSLMT